MSSLRSGVFIVVCASTLLACDGGEVPLSCSGLDGRTFISTQIAPNIHGGFSGHITIMFSEATAEINTGSPTSLSADYQCQYNQLSLFIGDQPEQKITINPAGFEAHIENIGLQLFEALPRNVEASCQIPHGTALLADHPSRAPFDYLIFHAFQSKVDLQKGGSLETYEVDCDTGNLHFHKNFSDESPIESVIKYEGFDVSEYSLDYQGHDVAYKETEGGFGNCLQGGDPVCAMTPNGDYLVFPNICSVMQVKAIELSASQCSL